MRGLILLVLIGVVFADNKYSCGRLSRVDCKAFDERKVCDKEGNSYRNICEFKKAKCKDDDLKLRKCDEGSGEELTKFQRRCLEIAKLNCAQKRKDKRCDNDGNSYRNKCAFRQAKCGNPKLKEVDCPRPTKPSKVSWFCKLVKQVDCKAMKERNVCDREGTVYRNKCEFQKAKCADDDLKEGKCRKPEGSGDKDIDDNDDYDDDHDDDDDFLYDDAKGSPANGIKCSTLRWLTCGIFGKAKVCDQNNKSYMNKCDFEKARCADKSLVVGKCTEGSGDGSGNGDGSGDGDDDMKFKQMCMKLKGQRCSWRMDYVCGSDRATYRNQCYFQKAKCQRPQLRIVSKGFCF